MTKHVPFMELVRQTQRPVIAALGMGVLLVPIRDGNLIALVALGAMASAGLLFLQRAFTPEERRVFRGVDVSFHPPGSGYLKRVEDRS